MKDWFVELFGNPTGTIIFQILDASQLTLYLSLIAFIGGGSLALVLTIMRVAPMRWMRSVSKAYVWWFQSVPLLMLLFLCGLGVPHLFDIQVSPWAAASVALILFTSAYMSEVWRGAVESVGQGQWEAGYALNLSFLETLRKIIFPQAVKYGLAPTVGFMVQIIKGTSLAYIIGFQDLMLIGKRWANAPVPGSEPFIIFPLMAVMYFSICYPLALYARHLEATAIQRT